MIESIQKLTAIAWDDIQVRNYRSEDVESIIDYFYEKIVPLPFRHLDITKRLPEDEFRRNFLEKMPDQSKGAVVIVDYKGKAIGMHTLTPVLTEHADFHAHYWDVGMRGKRIFPIAWYKACDLFFKRFGFERLYFKPPKDNPMSSGACRYIPVRRLEDEVLTYPILLPNILASVYEITREEFYALR